MITELQHGNHITTIVLNLKTARRLKTSSVRNCAVVVIPYRLAKLSSMDCHWLMFTNNDFEDHSQSNGVSLNYGFTSFVPCEWYWLRTTEVAEEFPTGQVR